MANLGTVNVEWANESHKVTLKTIHTLWAEEALGQSSEQIPAMKLTYAMTWQALRKAGVDVPESFDEFLALEPDIDQIGGGDEPGKDGTAAT